MIHTPADEVLLTLVVLWRLVVFPGLLLLWGLPLSIVVELAWGVLDVPLGTTISIVSHLATSETSITTGGSWGMFLIGVPVGVPWRFCGKLGRCTD
jgi:hypothetical protein